MIAASVQQSLNIWMISFLVRVHHVSLSEAAVWAGLGLGGMMTIGCLIVGPLADRHSGGRGSRLALIPRFGAFAASAAGAAMILAPNLGTALFATSLAALLAGFFLGPSLAPILSLTTADVRGSMVAFAKLATVAVGTTAITFLTGAIADMIGGDDGIPLALLATVALNCWAVVHYLRASRLAAAQEQLGG